MKNFLSIFSIVLLLGICSCNKDSGTPHGADNGLQLDPGQDQNITFTGSNNEEAVTFTAARPWQVSVSEKLTRANTPDWIEVSPMSGPAGDGAISITIKAENDTPYQRSATISISTGTGDPLIFVITQQNNSVTILPKLIKGMKITSDDPERVEMNYEFEYDGQGRMSKVHQSYTSIGKYFDREKNEQVSLELPSSGTTSFTYTEQMISLEGQHVSKNFKYDPGSDPSLEVDENGNITQVGPSIPPSLEFYNTNITETVSCELKAGKISGVGYFYEEIAEDGTPGESFNDVELMAYTDNRLSKMYEEGWYSIHLDWSYGNIRHSQTKVDNKIESQVKYSYGDRLNNSNLDLWWLLLSDGDFRFFLPDYFGTRSKYLPDGYVIKDKDDKLLTTYSYSYSKNAEGYITGILETAESEKPFYSETIREAKWVVAIWDDAMETYVPTEQDYREFQREYYEKYGKDPDPEIYQHHYIEAVIKDYHIIKTIYYFTY